MGWSSSPPPPPRAPIGCGLAAREAQEGGKSMDRRTFLKRLPALTAIAGTASALAAEAPSAPPDAKPAAPLEIQPIALPKPETDGGKSVLAALKERRTNRSIRADKLPPQVLSNLLWAAWGVNRDKGSFGKAGRTAPS